MTSSEESQLFRSVRCMVLKQKPMRKYGDGKREREASLSKIGRHFNRDQRSWWIKMVSSGLFHPSEVANIYQVIIVIESRMSLWCVSGE